MKPSNINLDPESSIRMAAEITRTCKLMRNAYLESRRDELLAIFNHYLKESKSIESPDPDAIITGFMKSWERGDYESITTAGALLEDSFFRDNREAHAFYLAAKKNLK